jgi:hypothetical protein
MSSQEFQEKVLALLDRLDNRLETLERSERQIREELRERAEKDKEHDSALARHDQTFKTTEVVKATLTVTGGALAYGVHLILQWFAR